MSYILCAGVLLCLALVLLILSCLAAEKEISSERLPAKNIWFMAGFCFQIMAGFCFVIGLILMIVGY